jgi:hypothetical protein
MVERYQNGIVKASGFRDQNSRPLMEFRMDRVADLTPCGSAGSMSLEFRDQIIAKLSFLRYERLCNESGFALFVVPFATIRYVLA